MGARQAVEVDEEVVPCLLLLITVLQGLEGQESAAPGVGSDDVLVFADDVEGGTRVGLAQEVGEDEGGVVGGLGTLEHAASRLEELWLMSVKVRYSVKKLSTYVTSDLLSQHVVVTLPGGGRQVVGVPRTNSAEAAVTVATASATADLQTVDCSARSQRLQTT